MKPDNRTPIARPPIAISPYSPRWPGEFQQLGATIRRALGATRGQIFWQYLTEAALLAAAGAALGLLLGALGLQGVHALYARGSIGPGGYQELTHVRWGSVLWALMLALVATLGAGFYPAWRLARLPPASYLKSEQ